MLSLIVIILTTTISGCVVPVEIRNPPAAEGDECAGTNGLCLISDHDKKQPLTTELLNQKIHEYLVSHPTEIAQIYGAAQAQIGQQKAAEAAAKLQKGIAEHRDAIFADGTDPVLGNPKGDITLVEYFDNECPWCKKLAPELDRLIALDPNVRIVMKEFPILDAPGVNMSTLAAKYALAANLQGKYAPFHKALMASTFQEHQLSEDNLKTFAKDAGLNMAQLAKDIARPELTQHLTSTKALAAQMGIGSTPTLLVETIPHAANASADDLERDIVAMRRTIKNQAAQKPGS
jgi:protein-disulfide isomerase